jgi:hypothetical protein
LLAVVVMTVVKKLINIIKKWGAKHRNQ